MHAFLRVGEPQSTTAHAPCRAEHQPWAERKISHGTDRARAAAAARRAAWAAPKAASGCGPRLTRAGGASKRGSPSRRASQRDRSRSGYRSQPSHKTAQKGSEGAAKRSSQRRTSSRLSQGGMVGGKKDRDATALAETELPLDIVGHQNRERSEPPHRRYYRRCDFRGNARVKRACSCSLWRPGPSLRIGPLPGQNFPRYAGALRGPKLRSLITDANFARLVARVRAWRLSASRSRPSRRRSARPAGK